MLSLFKTVAGYSGFGRVQTKCGTECFSLVTYGTIDAIRNVYRHIADISGDVTIGDQHMRMAGFGLLVGTLMNGGMLSSLATNC